MKKFPLLFAIGIILSLQSAFPTTALGAGLSPAITPSSQVTLLLQIEQLLQEVVRLQAKLAATRFKARLSQAAPYDSVFFRGPFEAKYLVEDLRLKPVGQSEGVRPVDQELFDLMIDVLGEEAVAEHVREWRIFYDRQEDLGGFVELIAGTNDWVVGVNRQDFDAQDVNSKSSFAKLFVHEYSHILFYNTPNFVTSYQQRFITSSDKTHFKALELATSGQRFTRLLHYYEQNRSRFVSDYATLNADEDMAETFVTYVFIVVPSSNNIKDQKIQFLNADVTWQKARADLRLRLSQLNLL